MKTLCAAVLAMSLAGCASLPYKVDGFEFKKTREFTHEAMTAYRIPREDLAREMAAIANKTEFQIVYLPKEEIALNITAKGTVNKSESHIDVLFALAARGLEVELIHNHNNQDLDPAAQLRNRPLYWIAPSIDDIGQYLAIGRQGSRCRYRIASPYGLLTMSASEELFHAPSNIYIYQTLLSAAEHMQMSLDGVNPDDLHAWAKNYRGIFTLSFEPTP